jgi:hypothetical protein
MEDDWASIWSGIPVSESSPEFILQCSSDAPGVLYTPLDLPWKTARAFDGFLVEMIGRISSRPTMRHWSIDIGGVALLNVEVWLLRIPVNDHVIAAMQHDPASSTQARRLQVDDEGDTWEEEWDRVKKAMRALHVVFKSPGPKPGEAKNTIFHSEADWHEAIRRDVLSRCNTVAGASVRDICTWLGISTGALYKLMKKWTPHNPEDLKAGRF